MDFSPAAATLFRDLGGLSDMVRRLSAEVAPPAAAALSEAAAAGAGAGVGESGGAAGEAVSMQTDVPPGEAAAGGSGGGGEAAGEGGAPAAVPYARRLLLKSLLRAIALASYAPGTGARPQVRVLSHLRM